MIRDSEAAICIREDMRMQQLIDMRCETPEFCQGPCGGYVPGMRPDDGWVPMR